MTLKCINFVFTNFLLVSYLCKKNTMNINVQKDRLIEWITQIEDTKSIPIPPRNSVSI